MVAKGVIFAAALMVMAKRSLALSCFPCDETLYDGRPRCGPTPICHYGLTKDVCGCCDVCAKGPGESCGGMFGFDGRCAQGLECQQQNLAFLTSPSVGNCVDKAFQGCVLNGNIYQDGDTNYDSCLIMRCNNDTWEYTQKRHGCGSCSVEGDSHIRTFDKSSFLPEGDGRKYKFSGINNFVITQKELDRFPYYGLNTNFVHCNPQHGANISCVKSISYYEPGIELNLVIPVQKNLTDPKGNIKVKFLDMEYQPTGKSALEFRSDFGKVLIFKHNYNDGGANFNCMNVVGSQGLSVSLCQHESNFPYLYVLSMEKLQGQLYGLCNTYNGTVQNYFTRSDGARTQDIENFADTWEIPISAK